jgi:hypothetical protein
MRYIILVQLLLFASAAFANDARIPCELVKESILSRSSSGLAQVSNLGDVYVMCHVPRGHSRLHRVNSDTV